jgi:putative sterol carrier protein
VAQRQIKLMKAGIMGEPNGPPQSSPEIQQIYFDVVSRAAQADAANGEPMTLQWKFSDAAPWHLRIDNGSTAAVQGEAANPDLTLETSWSDWIDVSMRGANPAKAMLRRRLRPHGSLRQLARMPKIFPPRPNKLG